MKKITTFAISAMALSSLAFAEVEASAYAGYHSKYIFRGGDLGGSDAMYDFGLDVGGSCDCGLDWYTGIWYATLSNGANIGEETDIYAGVSKDLGFGSVDLGFTQYMYGDSPAPNDQEIFLSLSTGYSGLDLGLTTYFGIGGGIKNTTLLEGSIGYSYNVNDEASVSLGVVAGMPFGAGLGSIGETLAYTTASLGLDYTASDSITLSPYVSYTEAAEEYGTISGDGFIGGATLTISF